MLFLGSWEMRLQIFDICFYPFWHNWPFVRGIHHLLVDSPHKGQVMLKRTFMTWHHHEILIKKIVPGCYTGISAIHPYCRYACIPYRYQNLRTNLDQLNLFIEIPIIPCDTPTFFLTSANQDHWNISTYCTNFKGHLSMMVCLCQIHIKSC